MTATDDPLATLEALLKEERRLYDEDRTSDEYDDALMALQDEAVNLAPALVEVAKALKGLLAAPTWADQNPRDMDEEDRVAERTARAVLKALEG